MIKELPIDFEMKTCEAVRNVTFHQVLFDGEYYLYERRYPGENNKKEIVDFELFKRKIVFTVDYIDDKPVRSGEQKVSYPRSNNFGKWAWSFSGKNAYDYAMQFYEKLRSAKR